MIMSTMLASVAEGMCLSDSLGLNNEALVEVRGLLKYINISRCLVLVMILPVPICCCLYSTFDPLSYCRLLSLRRPDDSCVRVQEHVDKECVGLLQQSFLKF